MRGGRRFRASTRVRRCGIHPDDGSCSSPKRRRGRGRKLFGIPDYEALPGYGRHDDLWIAATDGSRAFQLTNEGDTKDEGVLIPIFSSDGKRIA